MLGGFGERPLGRRACVLVVVVVLAVWCWACELVGLASCVEAEVVLRLRSAMGSCCEASVSDVLPCARPSGHMRCGWVTSSAQLSGTHSA